MKGNKGITLIALVITIIVLLILAAVSIAMLTGDNSILKNAQEAKKQSTAGTLDETVKIAVGNILTDNLGWPETTTWATLKAEILKIKPDLVITVPADGATEPAGDARKEVTVTAKLDQNGETQTVKVNLNTGAVTK